MEFLRNIFGQGSSKTSTSVNNSQQQSAANVSTSSSGSIVYQPKPTVFKSSPAQPKPTNLNSSAGQSRPVVSNFSAGQSKPTVLNSYSAGQFKPTALNSSASQSTSAVLNSSAGQSRPTVLNSSAVQSRPTVLNSSAGQTKPSIFNSSPAQSKPTILISSASQSTSAVLNSSAGQSRPSVLNSSAGQSRPTVLNLSAGQFKPTTLNSSGGRNQSNTNLRGGRLQSAQSRSSNNSRGRHRQAPPNAIMQSSNTYMDYTNLENRDNANTRYADFPERTPNVGNQGRNKPRRGNNGSHQQNNQQRRSASRWNDDDGSLSGESSYRSGGDNLRNHPYSGQRGNASRWNNNGGNHSQSNNRRNPSNGNRDQMNNYMPNNSSEYDNNNSPSYSQRNTARRDDTRRPLGFKKLEEITLQDPIQILQFFGQSRNYQVFLKDDITPDFIVLLMRCVGKICLAEFDQLKAQILVQICKSPFLKVLKNYIMGLHHTKIVDKRFNMHFWNDLDSFFKDLFMFCQSIIELSPSTAVDEFKILFDIITMSIEGLKKHQMERFTDEVMQMFEEVQIKFAITLEEEEKKAELAKVPSVSRQNNQRDLHLETPPDNFRDIDIMPSKHDLFHKPNFLRPNIVDGAYQSVEHYLDVQFRLMREDFIGPLRDAISDYMKDDKRGKRRYGSTKFYHNVRILNYSDTRDGAGIVLCYDEKLHMKYSKKQNEKDKNVKFSKKFLYGSLLLLVKKNFDEIIFSTIIDSDDAQYGVITASLDPQHCSEDLFKDTFLMIESDVYFPPYLHILEMLKRPALAESFPFKEYIIHAQVLIKPPSYLRIDNYKLFNNCQIKNGRWPNADELGLDKSQYDAYIMALTREFVTIQGPPGTGKTFIGLKVAETLLKNLYLDETVDSESGDDLRVEVPTKMRLPILVVCYTNHALDQFLEGLLPFTESLIRVGGQSKNEALKKFNLNNQKKKLSPLFYECRDLLKNVSTKLATIRQIVNIINSPVEIYDVTKDIRDIDCKKFFEKFDYNPEDSIPPLLYWLTMADKILGGHVVDVRQNIELSNGNTEEEEMSDDDEDEFDEDDIDDIHRQQIDFDDDLDLDVPVQQAVLSVNIKELRKGALEIEGRLARDQEKGRNLKQIQNERQKNALRFNMANIIEERLKRGNTDYPTDVTVTWHDVGENYDSIEHRWALYWKWHKEAKDKATKILNNYMSDFNATKSRCDELKQVSHLESLKAAHVVGVTTSGAARLQSLLRSLKSPIVIVEEAAEVMETHIIVSLTSSCQHLIMIGDHQQLRPITASYTLAKHYNLDISLFERMVKNGAHCLQLAVQHRMRPEISKLITPAIYPELLDHPSVRDYPHVRGVRENLFFIDHTVHERKVEDSVSRLNEHEANFALSLAKYLVQQGYDPSEITILATYSGQMFYIREQRKKISLLKNVHVVVLDNYQGEENKIIILSLVRSNPEGNIGFLRAVNRVCVALSRAKEGFYMIGNMTILKEKSTLWRQVFDVLDSQKSFGEYLELQCQIHRNVITPVKTASDFIKVAEGGCQSACNRLLKCGHYCKKLCHIIDVEHETYRCQEKCDKIICEMNHKCQDLCFRECKCMIKVDRTLPCGHVHSLPCSTDYMSVRCDIRVDDTLPLCDHKVKRPCYMEVDDVVCPEACVDRLPCGHSCRRRCHKKPHMDPKHLEYLCMMDCAHMNKGCSLNHACKKRCHEQCSECTVKVTKKKKCGHNVNNVECHVNADDVVCLGKCKRSLPCGHHCLLMCKDVCDPTKCKVKVRKVRPSCGHEVETDCGNNPENVVCRRPCDKIMSCRHKCKQLCYVKCDVGKCEEMTTNKYGSVCGHSYKIPCKDTRMDYDVGKVMTMKYCGEPCNAVLKGCDHICSGTCGKCWAGTLHVPCMESCGNILVCGHSCKDPCRLACPPCKMKCEVKCGHNKCPMNCGVPCPTCKESCKRYCKHGACKNSCGEECSVPPCSEDCDKTLECGHPCRGLCGEKCPDVCKVCKPDSYPEILFGEEDEDDARFIRLVDCSHVVEVGGMDTWMEGEEETDRESNADKVIKVAVCPLCKCKVTNTLRYAERVKSDQRKIQLVKSKVFGEVKEIEDRMKNLQKKLEALKSSAKHVASDRNWSQHFIWISKTIEKNLAPIKNKQNRHNALTVCLTDVKTFQTQLDVLQQISDIVLIEPKSLSCNYVQYLLKTLLENVKLCSNKVSEQQCEDINHQLTKLNTLVSATQIEFLPEGQFVKKESEIEKLKKIKLNIFCDLQHFDDKVSKRYKDMLNAIRKSMSIAPITDTDRKMIVAAIGLKQGHWYTCPNGHAYCIGECGGAMEISKCPECGEGIGGTGHSLLGSNRVAGFMDGARHGAWPRTNNIQDYVL